MAQTIIRSRQLRHNQVAKTGAYTLTEQDDTVTGDTNGGVFTLTLAYSSQ